MGSNYRQADRILAGTHTLEAATAQPEDPVLRRDEEVAVPCINAEIMNMTNLATCHTANDHRLRGTRGQQHQHSD